LSKVTFGDGDQGVPLSTVYDPNTVSAFASGTAYVYGEGELRWDDRRAIGALEQASVHDGGSLVTIFGGRVHRLDAGRDYWRYGLDLEHFVRLGAGPRVLALRFHGEGVTGSRDEVPFTELPRLGGPIYLRGYAFDRFRDRVAAFATVQYQWDLSSIFSANLFVDAGRVYQSLSALTFDQTRCGYGVSLELHTASSFVAEVSVASSIDGGLYVSLALNPIFDIDERVRRR
jgi:hypothetical protein